MDEYSASMTLGWYALMYAILLNASSKQAMQYFKCCPDERHYSWGREVKSDRVLQVARECPDLTIEEIAEEVGCSTSLLEMVIATARKNIDCNIDDLGELESKILYMNSLDPRCRYSTIASRLNVSRNMVRSTIFRYLPK